MDKLQREVLLAALDWFHCPTPHTDSKLFDALSRWTGIELRSANFTGEKFQAAIEQVRAKLTESENGQ